MAQWQRTLDLQPEWDICDSDDPESIQKLAMTVYERLAKLEPFNIEDVDERKELLLEEFLALAGDENLHYTKESFNLLMEELYNWGDTPLDDKLNGKKVCWINTM